MLKIVAAILLSIPLAAPCFAQDAPSTKVAFGGIKGDPSLPVTVTSESLRVEEQLGTALFEGDVLVVQGEMRLSADLVRAYYDENSDKVEKIWAEGNVILINAEDAAQSDTAEYIIDTGSVTMMGNVVLSQGPITFSAARLDADLTTGFGELTGRVTTTFIPNAANAGTSP